MTVDSGAFSDGGQLRPTQLPDGGLLDEEDDDDDEQQPEITKGMAPLWGSPAGKKYLAGMIARLLPKHKKYVEPFAGGGAVFWRKEPSEVEVLGDLDPDVAFSWKFARDCTAEQIAKLEEKNWTATRARFAKLRKLEPKGDVERFYKVRMSRYASFFNEGRTFNPQKEGSCYGIAGRLARRRDRLKGVKISQASYEKLVKEHDGPDTVFFLDPPYPSYQQNIEGKGDSFDGKKFAEMLRGITGKFLVTYGPKSDLTPFKGFTIRKVTTASVTPRGGVAQKVTVLISNYPLPKVIKKAKKPGSQGMMIALMLPQTAAEKLALPDLPVQTGRALSPKGMHLTLAYMGKIGEATREDLEGLVLQRARRAISVAASAHPPIEGKISGFGRFKEGALYASFDSVHLATLREAIAAAMDREGAAFVKEHGFTPHITLAFLEDGAETPDLTKLPKLGLRFDHVTLVVGGEQEAFPLGGALDAEPESLTTKELVAVHKYLHLVHDQPAQAAELAAPVHEHHAQVTYELAQRGAAPEPPANQLDVISKTLEPWDDQGRRFAHVCRSGIELGPPIKREDVMSRLSKPFQVARPGISLVGNLATDGETRGDIEVLLRLPPATSPALQRAITFRLERMLGADLARRMHVLLAEDHGCPEDHLPIYDLELVPRGERKRKEMRAGDPVPRSLEMPKNVVTSLDELRAFVKEHKGSSSGRMIDVFSGPGAMSLGFEKEGFEPVLALEASPYAAATYAMNRPSVPVLFGDCRKFAPEELARILGPAELVIGGVPCEAFSGARRSGQSNTSKGLIRYAMALVAAFKAQLFAFENVTAALKSRSWVAAKNLAERSGYGAVMLQLSADEHGAATTRKRGFFLGVKGGSALAKANIAGSAAKTLRDALEGLGQPRSEGLHATPPAISPQMTKEVNATEPGRSICRQGNPKWRRPGEMLLRFDHPATTLVSDRSPIHPGRKRRLTLREGLRIQGVPDSYKLATETYGPAWDLIGDMVPVPLARAVAQALKKAPSKSTKVLDAATSTPLAKLLVFDAQARKSQEEGRIEPSRFFSMAEPACLDDKPETAESLVAALGSELPIIVRKSLAGAHHQIHKGGEKVLVISAAGEDNTARFPQLVQAVRDLEPEQLVLSAVLERWDGAQQLSRKSLDDYICSDEQADDEAAGVVAQVYDLAHDGRDIHKCSADERMSRLADVGIRQSTERRPDLTHRLNRVPHHHAETAEQLERITRVLCQLPGSAGAVLKRADGQDVSFPAEPSKSQVRKAKTTTALLVEAGPPGTWSGSVAAILGKDMRAKITRLWQALSLEDRKRVKAAFNKMFEAEDVIFEVEDRYGPIAKQRDPYLDVPPETGTYRFVAQVHFRGKSMHGDLRFQTGSKQLLGWTLDVQIAGIQKTEVTTLPEARSAVSGNKMGRLSKIDFSSGDWAERPRRGSDKPVRTLVRAHRKQPQPAAWLNVEGVIEKPDPGEPPAAGATQRFPGVLLIADNGTVEYGAQKATNHEYFFQGNALNYRVFFRLLRLERRLQKSLEPCLCMVCKSEPAVFDGLPADCSAPAIAVCEDCVDSWATGQKGTVISKQQLPPAELAEKASAAEETWFAIRPDDPRPNVLQADEAAKGWMPPLGISALPKAVRLQVPEKLRYWKAQTAKKARELRDALVEALSEAPDTIDFEAPYKRTAKAAPRFVLQQQVWRGAAKQVWWVRTDTGKGVLKFELACSPLDNEEVSAAVGKTGTADLDARGDVLPGTALNLSRDTSSYIEQLDTGAAVVTERTDDRIVLELSGSRLDGVFKLQRLSEDVWTWCRGKDTRKFVPVIKVNEKEGIVTGIVMEPDEVDGQNEFARKPVIRKAAHDFLARYNQADGTKLGDMHNKFGQVGFDLIENWVQRGDTKIGSQKVKDGTWLQSWRKTPDALGDEAFRKFETRERTGFSIGGFAKVV